MVRLLFTSADGPPEVSVVSRPGSAVLVRPATRWAQNYRLPCFQGMGLRVEVLMNYRFAGENPGFRDIGLRRFVGGIRGIQHQRVSFDFNTMACPFELRLNYRQPLLPNRVQQVSDPHPARAPFLEWLAGAVLDLPDRSLDAVFADTVLLVIPCGKIDLHPQSALPPSSPKEKS